MDTEPARREFVTAGNVTVKIAYLCPDLGIPVLGRKGASAHVRGLVESFRRGGHPVVLVSPSLNGSPWEEPAAVEAQLLHLPPGVDAENAFVALKTLNATLGVQSSLPGELRRVLYDHDLAKQLMRRFEHVPPDFMYERASLYATAGVTAARELNVPILVEVNAPLAMEQSVYRGTGLGELAAQAERWTLTHADAVLTVSSPLRNYVVSLGVNPDRVHVVPNGVDPTLFQPGPPNPRARARWGLDAGPILGFVGGLRPWHGIDVLPELLVGLIDRYPTLRLVIVGDGPQRAELERNLRERGAGRSAVFTGSVPQKEVAQLIRLFDVAIAPYARLEHSFYFSPLKLFEYMACGIPVVAAATGQITEVVRDGETGLLYPTGDASALLAACDRLLSDPMLRSHLGAAAAKEIHGRYTWDQNAARVVDLARSLAQARRAAA